VIFHSCFIVKDITPGVGFVVLRVIVLPGPGIGAKVSFPEDAVSHCRV
jgi:hypothetical protein